MRGLKDSYDLWYKRCQTFLFPPWLKTKIQMLGVTILLSLTVFMNMVSEIIPNTSDAVSIIGIETIPEDFKFLEYEYTFHSTASLALSLVNRNIIILYIFTYLSCYMTLFEDNFLFSFLFIYQCMWATLSNSADRLNLSQRQYLQEWPYFYPWQYSTTLSPREDLH